MKCRFLVAMIAFLAMFSCARKNTASFTYKQPVQHHFKDNPTGDLYASTSSEYSMSDANPEKPNLSTIDSSNTGCDVLFFKDGKEINAKVLEINQREVVYRLCNDQNSPAITVAKSSIFLIKYANGTKEVMESSPTPSQQPPSHQNQSNTETNTPRLNNQVPPQRKLSVLALLSFLIPMVGLLILGIPAGLSGIILGIISFLKIEKNKDRLKGQGFSIAGIVLGATVLILTLVALVVLMSV